MIRHLQFGMLHDSCRPSICPFHRRIGLSVFHGHAAAMAVARFTNKREEHKVLRIVVRDGHFVLRPVEKEEA